jgi:peptidoglycan hydrolase-like protein with peptidoglycan-binding domain
MPNGLPTLTMGSTGLAVAYCQNLLNARGATQIPLWVDGMFGPKTLAAVRHFQMMRHILKKDMVIDGIVGPQTWEALEAGPPPIKKRPSGTQVQVPATAGF